MRAMQEICQFSSATGPSILHIGGRGLFSLQQIGTSAQRNLQTIFMLVPGCCCMQFYTQLLHHCYNSFSLVVLRTPSLELLNVGGIEEQTRKNCPDTFNDKQAAPIVSLNVIYGIIVKKVASAIENGFFPVDFNTSHNMAGMAKDDIGSSINQCMRERGLLHRRRISPIRSPVSRDHQNIHSFFGLSHNLKQMLSAKFLQRNGNVPDTWLFFCGCPRRFIVGKGEQSDCCPFHVPDGGCRCLTESSPCTRPVNSPLFQGTQHVKQSLSAKIKDMVIRQ